MRIHFTQRPWPLAVVLLVATFLAYQPARHAGFIWDDDAYITGNTLLTAPDGLKRIWCSPPRNDSYFPMVNTTLWFERRLWGLDPSGYHDVNILLHSLNALLIWAVLRRLTLPGAWLAAAIWALHPVNVESVAWITELKNTQSTLFSLLTLLAWMKFAEAGTARRWGFYALALLLYGPALFSKPTVCTLPAAMLLVLWLRKQRIDSRTLLQIVPFLSYGIAAGFCAIWCERYLGSYAEAARQSYGVQARLLIAAHALWFYAAKLAWPTRLTFNYPRWVINTGDPRQYVWLLACVAVALLLWRRHNRIGCGPIAAVVYFVAALSPLIGFIPIYTFRYSFVADHYQYLAGIGLIALFAAAASNWTDSWQLKRSTQCAGSALLLLLLAALTWKQAQIYRNAQAVWLDTLSKNPKSWLAHNNLGAILASQHRVQEAMEQYEQALRINPEFATAQDNVGLTLTEQGNLPEAIAHYEQALRIQPNYAEAHSNLGFTLVRLGRVQEAIAHYERALQIKPDYAQAQYNWGNALLRANKPLEAIEHYEQAVRMDPDLAEAHYNLGLALMGQGELRQAISHFEQALQIKPDNVQAQYNWGNALLRASKPQEAIEHFELAVRIDPEYVPARNNLASALMGQGRLSEAISHLQQVVRLTPDVAMAHYNLGFASEQAGQLQQAIEHYEQALRINPDFVQAQNALARARDAQ